MRRPLVFIERLPRIPERVELTMRVGEQTYRHVYDEPTEMTPAQSAARLTRELHAFASAAQDQAASTL